MTTPNGRPESTIAQNFASDLDSMFGLGEGVATLSQNVAEKQREVDTGQSELQQLEAKLRETEQRLAQASKSQPGDAQRTLEKQQQQQSNTVPQKSSFPGSDNRPTSSTSRPPAQWDDTQKMMTGVPGGLSGSNRRHYGGRDDFVMVDTGMGR